MDSYKIHIKRTAERELREIPKKDLQRITKKIGALSSDPRPTGCEKLSGQERYRLRQGNYRIVYSIDDESQMVMIVKIGHRREVYR
jgi:mRNA interferase RelE/StbE